MYIRELRDTNQETDAQTGYQEVPDVVPDHRPEKIA
jgi:hypothetical protein